jgi:hypothetical protein
MIYDKVTEAIKRRRRYAVTAVASNLSQVGFKAIRVSRNDYDLEIQCNNITIKRIRVVLDKPDKPDISWLINPRPVGEPVREIWYQVKFCHPALYHRGK